MRGIVWLCNHLTFLTCHDNCRATSALSVFLSARPAIFGYNASRPRSVAIPPRSSPEAVTEFSTATSAFSFSASSVRPLFSKLSIESCRCFICLRITAMESASESGRGQFQLYYLHFFEFRRYALRCFGRCLRETAELELRWAHRLECLCS